jgi:hypothetical protein
MKQKSVNSVKNNMSNSSWEKSNCPICGKDTPSNRPVVSSRIAAENSSWDQVSDLFIGFRKGQLFFSYYRCKNCETLYCPWFFSAKQLENLYRNMPDNLIGQELFGPKKTQNGYATWVNERVRTVSHYLEIGADIGLLAEAFDQTQTFKSVNLIEPNHSVQTKLLSSIRNCETVNVSDYIESADVNNIDLTVAVHVLDHAKEPMSMLNEVLRRTIKDGFIMIVVHDEKSLLRKILRKKWPPFCLQHPVLFNISTLSEALNLSGWDLVDYSKTTNHYLVKDFFKLMFSVFGIPERFVKWIPTLSIGIRTGNIIALAQKKYSTKVV